MAKTNTKTKPSSVVTGALHEAIHTTADNEQHADGEVHDPFPENWTPPAHLDAPHPRPGYKQRWIRVDLLGKADPQNVAAQLRQGWRPRSFETVPEGERKQYPSIAMSGYGEVMKSGDLILCEMPLRLYKQMRDHFAQKRKQQVAAIGPEKIIAQHNETDHSDKGFGEIRMTRRSTSGVGRRPIVAADEDE